MNRGENKRSGLAIAGLVLGIMGLVISVVPIINNFAAILGVLAVIFGIISVVGAKKTRRCRSRYGDCRVSRRAGLCRYSSC